MSQFVALLLLIGGLACLPSVLRAQAGPAAPARPSACALLTTDVVSQTSPYSSQQLKLVLMIPPTEDPVGRSGSACSYGGVTLQVDPFGWATIEKTSEKGWAPLTGVGEAAFFRDNQGEWAELAVRAGQRVLTIQMDVPDGQTALQVRSNAVALAKALLPRLQ